MISCLDQNYSNKIKHLYDNWYLLKSLKYNNKKVSDAKKEIFSLLCSELEYEEIMKTIEEKQDELAIAETACQILRKKGNVVLLSIAM